MTSAGKILSEDIDIPGYGEAIPDPARLPPYIEDLGGGTTHEVDADGNEYWYKHGELHRDGDLPALVELSGYKVWYHNGKIHRDHDLPAIISITGYHAWYKNGNRHRDGDKPAIIDADGNLAWYKNGKLHRDTGPARVWPGVREEEYWVDGMRVPKP